MKKLLLSMTFLAMVAACDTPQESAALGGLTGAAVGAAVSDDKPRGALIGGAAGVVAGALIGSANKPGKCRYRTSDGREYIADCPEGY